MTTLNQDQLNQIELLYKHYKKTYQMDFKNSDEALRVVFIALHIVI